jgi:molybdate transport system substrate-binding protein
LPTSSLERRQTGNLASLIGATASRKGGYSAKPNCQSGNLAWQNQSGTRPSSPKPGNAKRYELGQSFSEESPTPYNGFAGIGMRGTAMPPTRRAIAFFTLNTVLAISVGCATEADKSSRPTLAIAAAADLKYALDEILQEYRRSHPDIDVQVSYGSSGNFYRQLTERAPFDIFFSADTDYVRQLVEGGLTLKGSEFTYAVGHLVLWVRNESPLDFDKLGMKAVLDPSVAKIAIANPKYAPYGRAAQKALESAGLYDRIRGKIARGNNVAQAAQFVESGAADIGLIGLSQATAPPLRDEGRSWQVPGELYPPLEQAGVILAWAKNKDTAQKLRALVLGPAGRKVLMRYGFTLPRK